MVIMFTFIFIMHNYISDERSRETAPLLLEEKEMKPIISSNIYRDFMPIEDMLIQKHLRKYIKCKSHSLSKAEIEKYLKDIPELEELVNKIGFFRIIVKIRTEKKQKTFNLLYLYQDYFV